MKKYLSVILTAAMLTGALSVTAYADDTAEVYVTIADENGGLALAQEKITVTDNNGDGKLDIDEALYAAHEAKFDGGAAEGYGSYAGDYGLALSKLWGTDNGGSYGYYLNNGSAMSLADEVKTGDYINAFLYTDLTAWSDTYCFFDKTAAEGNEITLTLSAAGWDESYNPITVPVEGAIITIDGEKTDFVTDAEGKVTITADKTGTYVISAVSDTQTLVPPACILTAEVSDVSAESTATNPSTGVALSLISVAAAAVAAVISRKK